MIESAAVKVQKSDAEGRKIANSGFFILFENTPLTAGGEIWYNIRSSLSWERVFHKEDGRKGKSNGSIRSTRNRRQADACQGR